MLCAGFYRARQDALRVAHPRANEIEVVNAVIEDLKARCPDEKGPEMPGSKNRDPDFHIVEISNKAILDQLTGF